MATKRKVRHAFVSWETVDTDTNTQVSHLHGTGEVIDIDEIPEKRRNLLVKEGAFEPGTVEEVAEELQYVDDGTGNMVPIPVDEDGNVLPEARPVSDTFDREGTFDDLVAWVGSHNVAQVKAAIHANTDMADEIGQAEDEAAGRANREVRSGVTSEVDKIANA